MAKESQQAKILRMLKASKRGVENYKFPMVGILCANKRIEELRKDGHNILAERQYIKGRATGTWLYYLNEGE